MGEFLALGLGLGESLVSGGPGFTENQAWVCGDLERRARIGILGLFLAI